MRLVDYQRINWINNNPPPINAQNLNRMDAKLRETSLLLDTPDVQPALAPSGAAGQIEEYLSWFANRLRALSGEINWYDAPDATLADYATHAAAANPHTGSVPTARTLSTTSPLGGGGNFTNDRTLTIDTATEAARGVARFADETEAPLGTVFDRILSPGRAKPLLDAKQTIAELPLKIVRAASIANVDVATGGTAPAGMDTGVTLAAGDDVLLKNQTDATQNGIWRVAAGAWARSPLADTAARLKSGTLVVVTAGATYADQLWELATEEPITIGTTGLAFAIMTGGGGGGGADASSATKGVSFLDRDPVVATQPRAIGANSYTLETTIDGLGLVRNSADSLTVRGGVAWVPGSNRLLNVPNDITKSGLVLTANTWYFVYLFDNAGVADVEISTTAPVRYKGSARQKTGDASRRYLGAIRCGPTANTMLNFTRQGNFVRYKEPMDAAHMLVLTDGRAAVVTTVSAATLLPPTTRLAHVTARGTSSVDLALGASDDSPPPTNAPSGQIVILYADKELSFPLSVNASQEFQYSFIAGSSVGIGAGIYVAVLGYYEEL